MKGGRVNIFYVLFVYVEVKVKFSNLMKIIVTGGRTINTLTCSNPYV